MKTAISRLVRAVGMAAGTLWPTNASHAIAWLRDNAYSGFLRPRFHKMGRSTIKWRPYVLRGLNHIDVGHGCVFEKGLQLTAWETDGHTPHITIGNLCTLRRDCHITAIDSITIGDHLLTGTNVLITDNSHGRSTRHDMCLPFAQRPLVSKGPVTIGNHVWLGNNVCVMAGVTIGDGAIVGANSVVTRDIPPYSVAAGIPAKVVKQL